MQQEKTGNAIFGSTQSRKKQRDNHRKHASGIVIGPCSVMDGACRTVIIGRGKKEKTFHTQITIEHSGPSSWSRLLEVSYAPDEDSDLLGRNSGRRMVP